MDLPVNREERARLVAPRWLVLVGGSVGSLVLSIAMVGVSLALVENLGILWFITFHLASLPILAALMVASPDIFRVLRIGVQGREWIPPVVSSLVYLAVGFAYMIFQFSARPGSFSLLTPLVWPSFLIADIGCEIGIWVCIGD